jgi:hypothetical protein
MKIGAEAGLAGMSSDFGWSKVTKAHHSSLQSFTRYFLKGFSRPPSVESAPNPQEDEVVVFKDFFVAGLHIPPHLVLLDILHKF